MSANKAASKASESVASRVTADDTLAHVFAALGDPTRLKLVAILCTGGAFSISHLTQTTAISRQGVTKHLNVLAEAGVVSDIKAGRERLWQLEPASIDEAKHTLESIGREWEMALGRLKSFVEKND
ncbi:ArsR/SmtB family transcription factor [Undibacterium sp. Ji83W]|uniref:ArsR/SmtB family transcription factor n=1 Tax=Undibacterium sp. Ji83W TaxID=3413043 RepID=UPI003BEFD318